MLVNSLPMKTHGLLGILECPDFVAFLSPRCEYHYQESIYQKCQLPGIAILTYLAKALYSLYSPITYIYDMVETVQALGSGRPKFKS